MYFYNISDCKLLMLFMRKKVFVKWWLVYGRSMIVVNWNNLVRFEIIFCFCKIKFSLVCFELIILK